VFERILIVDDSKVSRTMTSGFVRAMCPKAQIIEAADGAQALLLESANAVEVAILDMNMPGVDGLEVARELRTRHPHMRICLLTANAQERVRTRAGLMGIHVLRKPVTREVVREALQRLGAVA
jgi:CheY-like chemotaxis protein